MWSTMSKNINWEVVKKWIIIFAISLIPTIYGGLLIDSVFDPLHHLNTIPAAVVNEDTGASPEGKDEMVNLGDQIAEKLLTNDAENNLAWVEMSAEEAQEALEVGQIHAVIHIPSDFSANAVSVGNEDPTTAKQAVATITSNDGSNVVMGSISRSFADALELSLDAKSSQKYLSNIYAGFDTLGGALGNATDGANRLHDGSSKAADASQRLASGLNDLTDGTSELNGGANRLKAGSSDLAGGANKLSSGTAEANQGAGQLANGLNELTKKFTPVPAQAQQLAEGSAKVADGAARLDSGAKKVSQGLTEMRGRVSANEGESLRNGIATLVDSTTRLHDGTTQLVAGTETIMNKTNALVTKLHEIHNAVTDLVDRMRNLSDSMHQVSTHAADLSSRLSVLQANYDMMSEAERQDAISQLARAAESVQTESSATAVAAKSIHDGANTMVNDKAGAFPSVISGAQQIADGARAVHTAAQDLDQSTGRLKTAVAGLEPKLNTFSVGLDRVTDGAAELSNATGQLANGARRVANGNATLSVGLNAAASGIDRSANGASTLKDGTQRLADGSRELADGASQLKIGASTLADGSKRLADGSSTAANGAGELSTGLGTLDDGTRTLADKLAEGAKKVPHYSAEGAEHLAEVASAPISIEAKRLNEVPTYGHGLAPYFMALSLWVGAIGYFLMFPAIKKTRADNPDPAWVDTLRYFSRSLWMAVTQSLLLIGVLVWGLGLEVVDLKGLVAYAVLSSLTFFAINQALVALLGAPGRFLALILAVIQLASAGGTYPIETSPSIFQWLHPFLPLTYAVESFRSMIAGGRIGVAQGVVIMAIWLVVGLVMLWMAVLIRNRFGDIEEPSEESSTVMTVAKAA